MEIQEGKDTQWDTANLHDFWRNIALGNRLIQVYNEEKSFLLTLEGFVGSGLLAGNAVIVIATREHLDHLLFRLQQQSLNVPDLIDSGYYIPLEVGDVIHTIMPGKRFDDSIFHKVISNSLQAVAQHNRHCYLFTEIAAQLLQFGEVESVEELDRCWNSLHEVNQFTLFSAIPGWVLRQSQIENDYAQYHGFGIAIHGDIGPPTEISFRRLSN